MLLVRIMDDRMMRLQRQGRLGFYMKSIGEEATPLRGRTRCATSDWVFPSYREQGAWFWRGYTLEQFIDQMFGNADDPIKGRQMPVHHSASWLNSSRSARRSARRSRRRSAPRTPPRCCGKDDVAMVYFGEGTTSTGEFHVGMNFAGVCKAPSCSSAATTAGRSACRREKQTAAKTFADKAVGYGMPGVRVDGNDMLAVIAGRARGGRARARRRRARR